MSKVQIETSWRNTAFGWRKAIIYNTPAGKAAVRFYLANEEPNAVSGWNGSVCKPRYYKTYGGVIDVLDNYDLLRFVDTDRLKRSFFPVEVA